jgi:HAD superfamily hydrolase (TIGR01509 family)
VTSTPALPVVPFEAVIFDFHSTLIDQGSGREWLEAAWQCAGRDATAASVLGEAEVTRVAEALERIWDDARDIDPESERDLDSVRHRAVFDELVRRMGGGVPDLADALYGTLTTGWAAYDDAAPVLQALRDAGLATAVLSNVGFDIRPVLDRTGLSPLFDVVVLSCEIGLAKPDPEAFRTVLQRLGAQPETTLMVGDKWQDDGGASGVGIRSLILPPTAGPSHGLAAVWGLVRGLS